MSLSMGDVSANGPFFTCNQVIEAHHLERNSAAWSSFLHGQVICSLQAHSALKNTSSVAEDVFLRICNTRAGQGGCRPLKLCEASMHAKTAQRKQRKHSESLAKGIIAWTMRRFPPNVLQQLPLRQALKPFALSPSEDTSPARSACQVRAWHTPA